EAVGGDGLRVFGAQHYEELALRHVPADVGTESGSHARDIVEHARGSGGDMIVDVVRSLATEHGDHALVRGEAETLAQRRPGRAVVPLGDAVGELGRTPLRRHVVTARPAATHVHEDQPQGAADGGVGAEAWAEEARARVHADGRPHRATHDDERRYGMRGRLHAVEIEDGLEDGLDRSHHDGEVRGLAARHDRVDGELLDARLAPDGRHHAQHAGGTLRTGREHGADTLGSRWHDGQAVAPLALDEFRVDVFLGYAQSLITASATMCLLDSTRDGETK